ncbi:hypothetical protein CO058_01405 [candidate division WWE3 bacterium CG_4_9_14_0_2_um_filter_35_11]|uniref:PIN domain-containing protein n=1 Tax=candidate division WWE3 bacterium CG_4_9_14_0_2_um_filter_35_11 TaxID=1975077 RepID=A0A2M8EMA7_UNCKA|nr:MAG: hypothetical protein COV25_01330 [candidate division WWE3 bacterium CG10_big_fil_rev_8_21_14_0_10_35_32]PJC23817.1 MAG: hypothetical protein CO058_01405 [candidate division WWE3 bacterium CG_4_9_14_0_2_um_filter_35_11]
MITIDTSALIRFFTNDIPNDAKIVKNIIDSEEEIIIPDVVFPEIEYVLLGQTYNSTRLMVLKAFQFLSLKKNIKLSAEVLLGIELYANSNLDIADCVIAGTALNIKLISFDKKLLKLVKDFTF